MQIQMYAGLFIILASILILSKAASFHNKSHIFLYAQKLALMF